MQLSDLLFIIPSIPHLRNIKLVVSYRELPESEESLQKLVTPPASKWKKDPDAARYNGWSPHDKYFINGVFVGENLPQIAATSKEPFPEHRVPRRNFRAVGPDDPDYIQLCEEQGLRHLISHENSMHTSVSVSANTTVDGESGGGTPMGDGRVQGHVEGQAVGTAGPDGVV